MEKNYAERASTNQKVRNIRDQQQVTSTRRREHGGLSTVVFIFHKGPDASHLITDIPYHHFDSFPIQRT